MSDGSRLRTSFTPFLCRFILSAGVSGGEQIRRPMLLLLLLLCFYKVCLQCFDTVGWAAGMASGLQQTVWWGAGVVICLERGAGLHMAQLMPLQLTVSCFSKIQIGFYLSGTGSPG